MAEKDERPNSPKKAQIDLRSIPARQYLDQTVLPVLLTGLSELVKERPADSIGYLANYLLKHRDNSSQNSSDNNS